MARSGVFGFEFILMWPLGAVCRDLSDFVRHQKGENCCQVRRGYSWPWSVELASCLANCSLWLVLLLFQSALANAPARYSRTADYALHIKWNTTFCVLTASNFRLFVWNKYKWSLLFPSIWVFVCGTHFDSFLLRWHIFHVFFWLN